MEIVTGLDINASDVVYRTDAGAYIKTRVLRRLADEGVDALSRTNSITIVVSGSLCDDQGQALAMPEGGYQIAPAFTHTINVAGLLAGGQALEDYVENARLKCAYETERMAAMIAVLEQFVPESTAPSAPTSPTPPNPMLPIDPKSAKLLEINNGYLAAIEALVGDTPEPERLTWPDQEREARAVLADPNAATPVLSAIAEARGLTVLELAERVVVKADAYRLAAARLTGQRQAYEDRVNAATTEAELTAIAVFYS